MQKIGSSEKSVDQEFETLRAQYKSMVKMLKNIDAEQKKTRKIRNFQRSI